MIPGHENKVPSGVGPGPGNDAQNVNTQHMTGNMAVAQALDNFARTNTGHQGVHADSDGESVNSLVKSKRKGKKSGMVACPADNIKTPQVWPHYNLSFGFVTAAVPFHQLSCEQYIAGETKTILMAEDPLEIRGQVNLMSRLVYLKHRGHAWSNLHSLYAAIVNHIEKHEGSWVSDWKFIEDMVLESAIRGPGEKGVGKSSSKGTRAEQWYCRKFNREDGCDKGPPHEAVIRGRHRQVKHFCAKCWVTEGETRPHPEIHPRCPHAE